MKFKFEAQVEAQEKSFTVKDYSFADMLFKLLRYLTPVFPVPKHSWLDACYYSIHSNIFMISYWSFIDYILVPKISPNTDSNTAKFLIFTFVSYTA